VKLLSKIFSNTLFEIRDGLEVRRIKEAYGILWRYELIQNGERIGRAVFNGPFKREVCWQSIFVEKDKRRQG